MNVTFTDQETKMTTGVNSINALIIDTISPDAVLVRKGTQNHSTNQNSAWFSLTLSEPDFYSYLTGDSITLSGTTGAVTTFKKIDALHYEVEVTGMTPGDTVTATLGADMFYDQASKGNTQSTGAPNNTVTYDLAAPTGTVTPVPQSTTTSPGLNGTVDAPDTAIQVIVNSTAYAATNNSDGTWTLPAGTIAPLSAGTHVVVVAFSDAAGNTFTVPMSVVVAGSGTGSGIGTLIPSLAATGANTWLVMSGGLIALLAGGWTMRKVVQEVRANR